MYFPSDTYAVRDGTNNYPKKAVGSLTHKTDRNDIEGVGGGLVVESKPLHPPFIKTAGYFSKSVLKSG